MRFAHNIILDGKNQVNCNSNPQKQHTSLPPINRGYMPDLIKNFGPPIAPKKGDTSDGRSKRSYSFDGKFSSKIHYQY